MFTLKDSEYKIELPTFSLKDSEFKIELPAFSLKDFMNVPKDQSYKYNPEQTPITNPV